MSPTVAGAGPAHGDADAPEAPDARRRTLAWLDTRLEGVPDDLAEAVRACVRAVEPEPGAASVPDLLARAAVGGLDRVVSRRSGSRVAAVRLLAADAALTYAFEAAADLDADVPALARDVGLRGRIGERLAVLEDAGPAPRPDGATRGGGGDAGEGDAGEGDEAGGGAVAEGQRHTGPRAAEPGGDEA